MSVTLTKRTFDHNPMGWLASNGFSFSHEAKDVTVYDDGINIARVYRLFKGEDIHVVQLLIVEE